MKLDAGDVLLLGLISIVSMIVTKFTLSYLSEDISRLIGYVVLAVPSYSLLRYLIGYTGLILPRIIIPLDSGQTFMAGLVIGFTMKFVAYALIGMIVGWTILRLMFGLPTFGEVVFEATSLLSKEEKSLIKEFKEEAIR